MKEKYHEETWMPESSPQCSQRHVKPSNSHLTRVGYGLTEMRGDPYLPRDTKVETKLQTYRKIKSQAIA